jgi:hypothetical protein
LSCSPPITNPAHLPAYHTGVADTDASGIYFSKYAPVSHPSSSAPSICVGTANGTIPRFSTSAQLKLKNLPLSACQGHIMPSFPWTLVDITPLCDADLNIIFTKHDVKAQDQAGTTNLKGWQDPSGANIGIFPSSTLITIVMKTHYSLLMTNWLV